MKKMMLLMLTFLIMGVASMNAQVQIGGTNGPDKSAVLDLNGDAGTANGGLALPRIALTAGDQKLNNETPQSGTVVYNTGSALDGEGTYVWTKASGSNSTFSGISVDNTGIGTTVTGAGTPVSNLKVSIKDGGIGTTQLATGSVTNEKIAAHTIAPVKIATVASNAGQILKSNGTDVTYVNPGFAVADSISRILGSTIASPTTVTWKKVFDSDATVFLQPGYMTRYTLTGITAGDYCINTSSTAAAMTFGTGNNILYLVHNDIWRPDNAVRIHILCFGQR